MYMMKFLMLGKKVIEFERLKFYVQIKLVFADLVTYMYRHALEKLHQQQCKFR